VWALADPVSPGYVLSDFHADVTAIAVWESSDIVVRVSPTSAGYASYVIQNKEFYAFAADGYTFDHWEYSNDEYSISPVVVWPKDNPYKPAEVNYKIYTAVFTAKEYDLTVRANDDARGTVTFKGTPKTGYKITLTATPNEGYTFKEWRTEPEGVEIGADNKFIMPPYDLTVTAVFVSETEPEFVSHSLVLSGELGMNFTMSIPAGITDGSMTFKVGNRTADAVVTAQSGGEVQYTYYVTSVEMAETITAAYSCTMNGETKTVTDSISVKEYLETIITNTENKAEYTAATPLAKALYNYGHYAMSAVPDGPNHLEMPDTYAGTGLVSSLSGYGVSASLSSNVTAASYSLSLDSETAINIYLTTDSELTESDIGVSAPEGTTFDYTAEKAGSRTRVTITGIGAHELGSEFTVTVGTSWIKASALSYVQKTLSNGNAAPENKNAAAALYAYYEKAVEYRTLLNSK